MPLRIFDTDPGCTQPFVLRIGADICGDAIGPNGDDEAAAEIHHAPRRLLVARVFLKVEQDGKFRIVVKFGSGSITDEASIEADSITVPAWFEGHFAAYAVRIDNIGEILRPDVEACT